MIIFVVSGKYILLIEFPKSFCLLSLNVNKIIKKTRKFRDLIQFTIDILSETYRNSGNDFRRSHVRVSVRVNSIHSDVRRHDFISPALSYCG